MLTIQVLQEYLVPPPPPPRWYRKLIIIFFDCHNYILKNCSLNGTAMSVSGRDAILQAVHTGTTKVMCAYNIIVMKP